MRTTKTSSLALIATLLLACAEADPKPLPHEPDAPEPEPEQMEPDQPAEPDPAPETAAFHIELVEDRLPVAQGGTQRVTLRVVREPGFDGAVTISAAGLPPGVSFASVSVPAGQHTVEATLSAASGAAHSLPTEVTFRGVSGELQADEHGSVTVTGLPGALDTSFAAGKPVMPSGSADEYGYAVAVQRDGKVVAVGQSTQNYGDFAVMRVGRDGAPDTTFGSAGLVSTQVGTGADVAQAVALQADGKILVAGSSVVSGSGLDFALVRYTADGKLDASFGSGGIVTTAFGSDSDTAYALLVQSDGKILVGGESNRGSTGSGVDFALARYLADGSLDPSFGGTGKVTTNLVAGSGRDTIYALTLQQVAGETRIVAAGGEGDFALARYTDKGELDPSFGNGGKKIGLLGSAIGTARALQLDTQGRILVAGHHTNDFAMVRLSADGALDASFGSQGKVVTKVSADNWDAAHGIALLADGRIVLGGWAYAGNGTAGNFALARYSADGALDASFGAQGLAISDISGPTRRDEIRAVALQNDERVATVRVVVAGFAGGANQDFAIGRYWL
jgi:uncharacterized delta-60 repeat protein